MKRFWLLPVLAIAAGCATTGSDLPTQSGVDLQAYAGTWHEQARLPHRFQSDCAGDVQAEYALRANNRIDVINQCRAEDGSTKVARGEGRLSTSVEPRNPAQLEVRFAPDWTAWVPAVWGDYWIMRIDGDYEYSLVGTPDRQYLWVLSRDRQGDPATVQRLLDYAASQGFNTDDVIMTNQ